jgi:hypothetical protein
MVSCRPGQLRRSRLVAVTASISSSITTSPSRAASFIRAQVAGCRVFSCSIRLGDLDICAPPPLADSRDSHADGLGKSACATGLIGRFCASLKRNVSIESRIVRVRSTERGPTSVQVRMKGTQYVVAIGAALAITRLVHPQHSSVGVGQDQSRRRERYRSTAHAGMNAQRRSERRGVQGQCSEDPSWRISHRPIELNARESRASVGQTGDLDGLIVHVRIAPPASRVLRGSASPVYHSPRPRVAVMSRPRIAWAASSPACAQMSIGPASLSIVVLAK